jgi:hypothetical protein
MYVLMTQSQYDSRTQNDYEGNTVLSINDDMYIVQLKPGLSTEDAKTEYFIGKDAAQKYMHDNAVNWIEEID